jgi:hypothetical protein
MKVFALQRNSDTAVSLPPGVNQLKLSRIAFADDPQMFQNAVNQEFNQFLGGISAK